MDIPIKFEEVESLSKWFVKGINRKLTVVSFIEPVLPSEAATRVLEKEIILKHKITLAKNITVYGPKKDSRVYIFKSEYISANAGKYKNNKS